MNRLFTSSTVLILTCGVASIGRADVFDVRMGHSCALSNGVAGDQADFQTTTSPLMNSHAVALGSWSCSSEHSGSFDDQQGTFLMNDELVARDNGDYTYTLSAGGASLRTTSDLLVTFEGFIDYSLPGNAADASLVFSASRIDFPSGVVTTLQSELDGLISPIDPVSGTFHVGGSFVLPANPIDSVYFLGFQISLYTSAQSPNTDGLLTGTGSAQFSFSTIPEPASAAMWLLAVGTCKSIRRNRRLRGVPLQSRL